MFLKSDVGQPTHAQLYLLHEKFHLRRTYACNYRMSGSIQLIMKEAQ